MTTTHTRRLVRRTGAWALPVAIAAVTLVAGCGSTTTATGSTQPTNTSSSTPAAGGDAETIGIRSGEYGTYLTADDGRSVYLWEADKGMASSCSSACASVWPPVTTEGAPKAEDGALTADLGTIKRSDGTTQVTYQGHPLYYYAPDAKAGQVSGQGSDSFGAKWWLVGTDGKAITKSDSSDSSSSSGGGYGY
jgi:predicted lipoprotein with Yx(FWY)xxD motif